MTATSIRKPLAGVALATALLLLVPAVVMQFTDEVSWGPGDFVVAAVLLFGAGVTMVLGVRHATSPFTRAAVVVAVALGLAVVWAELAVGLFY